MRRRKKSKVDGENLGVRFFKRIIEAYHDSKKITTNPGAIKRKAEKIRLQLKEEKILQKDLDLIRYDNRMKKRKKTMMEWAKGKLFTGEFMT